MHAYWVAEIAVCGELVVAAAAFVVAVMCLREASDD